MRLDELPLDVAYALADAGYMPLSEYLILCNQRNSEKPNVEVEIKAE